MTVSPRRLAVLHSRFTPPGAPHHMISVIERYLRDLGVEVVHLYSPHRFVPADAILVHVDLSVVPDNVASFAAKYPIQINAGARDIRKTSFADGLLERWNTYDAPVIVKSDLNYGGLPELQSRSLANRALEKALRLLSRRPAPKVLNKSDYRVYPTLADVPGELFAEGTVVQKFLTEKDGDRNLLREYIFLGNLHYQNIERSTQAIISEDEHVSCEPFVPHPRLMNLRQRLKLDYGKIDYVMVNDEPFIFDANKTMGLGEKLGTADFGVGVHRMLKAFAAEIRAALLAPGSSRLTLKPLGEVMAGNASPSTQPPLAARQAATG